MLTLHHLLTSRSSRVVWLLEGLGIEYKLVVHHRGKDRRSQADLFEIHPLGKAPAIVDGDLVLIESASILRYIAGRYGNGRFVPTGINARAKHDEWLDYVESSLMMPLILKMGSLMGGGPPSGLERMMLPEFDKAMKYIADGIMGPFLMGNEITLADMQLSYTVALMDSANMLADHPAIQAYWERLQAEPGYKRTIEVGGPMVWRLDGKAAGPDQKPD